MDARGSRAPDNTDEKPDAGKVDTTHAAGGEFPPITVLVASLREQFPRLIRGEVALLKADIGERRTSLITGSGMLVGTAVVGFFGLAALIAAIVVTVSQALAPWLSALLVVVTLLLLAGLFAWLGVRKMKGNNGSDH
jgi:hypothetical protein